MGNALDTTQIITDLTTLVQQVNVLNARVKEIMIKARRLQDQAKIEEIRHNQGLGV